MADIRVYLKENETNILDFPITPSEVGVEGASELELERIHELGEVALFSGKNLKTTELAGFFPNQYYPFCNYKDIKKPYEYVRQVEKWMYNGTKLRLIIADTHTNIQVMINNFKYDEQFGGRDVYFSLSLVECVDIKLNRTSNSTSKPNNNNTNRPTENKPNTSKKTHKVVKGDTLWDIAKKYYGKGSDYPKIKEKNKKKYPSLAKNNYIYANWELEL